jgi:hypothetical protein
MSQIKEEEEIRLNRFKIRAKGGHKRLQDQTLLKGSQLTRV